MARELLDLLMNKGFWDSPFGGAVTSFGFPALAQLFGAGKSQQEFYDEMKKIGGDEWFNDRYNKNTERLFRGSVADRTGIMTDSMGLANSLQSKLASVGADLSGMGAVVPTLAASSGGNQLRRLDAFNRKTAYDDTRSDQMIALQNRAAIGPRPTPNLDALAAGGDNFNAFLSDYFERARQGGGSGGVAFRAGRNTPTRMNPMPMLSYQNPFLQLGRGRSF